MGSTKALHPGAEVRVYRDGTEIAHSVLIAPSDHNLEIRHLDPGSYLARDGLGNEVEFVVDPHEESAVLRVRGVDSGAKAVGPGGALVDDSPVQLVGPVEAGGEGPTHPDPVFAKAPKADVDADVPVPAEPGSALVEVAPVVGEVLEPGQEIHRVNKTPENVEAGETDKDDNAVRPRRRAKVEQVKPEQDATEQTVKQAARAASKKK